MRESSIHDSVVSLGLKQLIDHLAYVSEPTHRGSILLLLSEECIPWHGIHRLVQLVWLTAPGAAHSLCAHTEWTSFANPLEPLDGLFKRAHIPATGTGAGTGTGGVKRHVSKSGSMVAVSEA